MSAPAISPFKAPGDMTRAPARILRIEDVPRRMSSDPTPVPA
ncbi:MAG TPA: hypothetical protein VFW47_00835 [Phenylobacterium sp.]|nr:hypothetical protein [Phenylobacterium sp.]